jgi:hypothetical protein
MLTSRDEGAKHPRPAAGGFAGGRGTERGRLLPSADAAAGSGRGRWEGLEEWESGGAEVLGRRGR